MCEHRIRFDVGQQKSYSARMGPIRAQRRARKAVGYGEAILNVNPNFSKLAMVLRSDPGGLMWMI